MNKESVPNDESNDKLNTNLLRPSVLADIELREIACVTEHPAMKVTGDVPRIWVVFLPFWYLNGSLFSRVRYGNGSYFSQ